MNDMRLENLETKVDGVVGGLAQLATKVDGLESRVGSLETKVDGLTTRVDGLTTKVDDLDGKVDKLETKVDTGFDQVRRDLRHELGLAVEEIRADIKAIPDHRPYIDHKMALHSNSPRNSNQSC